MPIYEYYCSKCHTIFNFYVRSSTNDKKPQCPKCGKKNLEKQISRFAISKGLSEPTASADDPFAGMDEEKMEQAMMGMAGEFENMNEDDPRQMAKVMKKLFDSTGIDPGDSIQEAIRRMESGEDPDKIEEDMGAELDATDPFTQPTNKKGKGSMQDKIMRMLGRPKVDPELYDL